MLSIAICDDSERDALKARQVIKQTLNELNIESEIIYYLSGKDIEDKLFKYKETLDILILDIDMPDISGLELAEKLRNNNMNLIIIFLSNHEEFVFKAIEFQPFRYIRKIKIEDEMPIAIKSAVRTINSSTDKQLVLSTDDGEFSLLTYEIAYFETEGRKLSVHLCNGMVLHMNKTISEIFKLIDQSVFVSISRGCIVNLGSVKNVKNEVLTMKNGDKLLISRRKIKLVKQAVLNFWGNSI